MRSFTYEEIDALWRHKADMEPEEAQPLVEAMGSAQPAILTYLLASGDDILTEMERQVTFFMGVLLWHVISELAKENIRELSTDELIETEDKNFQMLEYLAGEPDSEFMTTVARIMENYNQATLLQYIIERIMEEPDKDIELYDNHVGMMVIYLKSVIDCFDKTPEQLNS